MEFGDAGELSTNEEEEGEGGIPSNKSNRIENDPKSVRFDEEITDLDQIFAGDNTESQQQEGEGEEGSEVIVEKPTEEEHEDD